MASEDGNSDFCYTCGARLFDGATCPEGRAYAYSCTAEVFVTTKPDGSVSVRVMKPCPQMFGSSDNAETMPRRREIGRA